MSALLVRPGRAPTNEAAMLVKDVKIGDTVEFRHERHGIFGSMRIESKAGNVVRLIFDVPRAIVIRAIERASQNTYGLSGGERENSLHHVAVS